MTGHHVAGQRADREVGVSMDFSKLRAPIAATRQIDPVKIFEQLPSLPGTPNDLWRGQAEALRQWHLNRSKRDVLIALNTGAGKTLVGLLVAQSLVHEQVENVIYLCATIDLVAQTSREAKRIGIEHTTRVKSGFDNDYFQSGRAFCITTYHALFNGLSAIRRRHFPGAVVFDDAHVAETMLRDALTVRVNSSDHRALFSDLVELFRTHFTDLRIGSQFNDSLSKEHPQIVLSSPEGLLGVRERLSAVFDKHDANDDDRLKYAYSHLRDRIECCAALFGNGSFELTPPFLPALALDIFERPLRRVYLSATLRSKTDLVRAFGRLPDTSIEPDNDAGNGERLILFGRTIPGGISQPLISSIIEKHKTLIAVPSYSAARAWANVATPPAQDRFSADLECFRTSKRGSFLLVSRVDGIDLPHDTCRVMVIDGLPSGSSLLEQYQWEFLRMANANATRIANRLVQLFGRINRGRNDYGVFLISGSGLNSWLNNDRNIALLPQLLQRQLTLGRTVQEGMGIRTSDSLLQAIGAVISREQSWLDFYGDNIKRDDLDDEQVIRMSEAEPRMVTAAQAEAEYAAAMWTGDYSEARRILDESIEDTARADALLAGWQSVWLGAAFEVEGDRDSARLNYRRAVNRLGSMIALPRTSAELDAATVGDDASPFARSVDRLVSLTSSDRFNKELSRVRSALRDLDGASPRQMEESVRALGEQLGLSASRPDNDFGTGPDVVWKEEVSNTCLAFELKTDKEKTAKYWKKEISSGHDHLCWLSKNYADCEVLGLLFVGPDGELDSRANPSESMWQCLPSSLQELRNDVLSLLSDLRNALPLERLGKIRCTCGDSSWELTKLFERLRSKKLLQMPRC